MELMRYLYEDTQYNVNENKGNRVIGTKRTAEAHLYQYSEGVPVTQWLAMGNPKKQRISALLHAYHRYP